MLLTCYISWIKWRAFSSLWPPIVEITHERDFETQTHYVNVSSSKKEKFLIPIDLLFHSNWGIQGDSLGVY